MSASPMRLFDARNLFFSCLISGVIFLSSASAVSEEAPLKIFGYFQTEFRQDNENGIGTNSFLTQQLNLFLQKDLKRDWTSFVNFEFLNSYSSLRDWGSFNLEEAWVGYRSSSQFKIKFGLQIPEFNNLNTIKNRTPLLPYIIRPLVYETSFGEFINLEIMTPARAFIQAYGSIPSADMKLDYSIYLGNSSNIRTRSRIVEADDEPEQSGIDTTGTFLLGGRLGIRYNELKAGVSGTHEKLNEFSGFERFLGPPASRFIEMPLNRLGFDLSFDWKRLTFESEAILVSIDREFAPGTELNAEFYYATLGYYITEKWFAYGSWSRLDVTDFEINIDQINPPADTVFSAFDSRLRVDVPTIGISYSLNDEIVFKGQIVLGEIDVEFSGANDNNVFFRSRHNIDRYALAVSAFF